jgi:hypothetical protein
MALGDTYGNVQLFQNFTHKYDVDQYEEGLIEEGNPKFTKVLIARIDSIQSRVNSVDSTPLVTHQARAIDQFFQ